jgi:hypothetical protein
MIRTAGARLMHSLRTFEETGARQDGGNFLAQNSFSCSGSWAALARSLMNSMQAMCPGHNDKMQT